MSESKRIEDLKNVLLVAGLHEIEEYGLENFSVRRIASSCGISCATPYRYFKDKAEYLSAISEYVCRQWLLLKNQIMEVYSSDTRRQIKELCVAYIRFWIANPNFISPFSFGTKGTGGGFFGSFGGEIETLFSNYFEKSESSKEEKRKKLFLVRSIITGTADMLCMGELENSEKTMDTLRSCLDDII